mgnify:CR=1 FL=1
MATALYPGYTDISSTYRVPESREPYKDVIFLRDQKGKLCFGCRCGTTPKPSHRWEVMKKHVDYWNRVSRPHGSPKHALEHWADCQEPSVKTVIHAHIEAVGLNEFKCRGCAKVHGYANLKRLFAHASSCLAAAEGVESAEVRHVVVKTLQGAKVHVAVPLGDATTGAQLLALARAHVECAALVWTPPTHVRQAPVRFTNSTVKTVREWGVWDGDELTAEESVSGAKRPAAAAISGHDEDELKRLCAVYARAASKTPLMERFRAFLEAEGAEVPALAAAPAAAPAALAAPVRKKKKRIVLKSVGG